MNKYEFINKYGPRLDTYSFGEFTSDLDSVLKGNQADHLPEAGKTIQEQADLFCLEHYPFCDDADKQRMIHFVEYLKEKQP